MKILKMIGYWQESEDGEDYPHPRDLVDPNWENGLRHQIATYLRSGEKFRGSWGYSKCRFDDGRPDTEMGSMELTDGVYAWPEGLAVYVEHYNVVLPQDFVDHMKEQNFMIPVISKSEKMRIDLSYWIKWASNYIASKMKPPAK